MKFSFNILALVLIAFTLLLFAAPQARAGYEGIVETKTMDSGTSIATLTVPLAKSQIKDVIVFVPTLDADDTCSVSLTVNAFDTKTYVPRGWSDKLVGATEDNGVTQCNASALDITVDGSANIKVQTSTNQAAARVFKFLILLAN